MKYQELLEGMNNVEDGFVVMECTVSKRKFLVPFEDAKNIDPKTFVCDDVLVAMAAADMKSDVSDDVKTALGE